MPMDRSLYPENWEAIAFSIKQAAGWCCQQCSRPCRQPGESDSDLYNRLSGSIWAPDMFVGVETEEFGLIEVPKAGRFILTVAHLNHIPSDCRPENLKALCSVCHLRYDNSQRATKRRLKRERLGQLTIPLGGETTA